jgi:hypothetical protein
VWVQADVRRARTYLLQEFSKAQEAVDKLEQKLEARHPSDTLEKKDYARQRPRLVSTSREHEHEQDDGHRTVSALEGHATFVAIPSVTCAHSDAHDAPGRPPRGAVLSAGPFASSMYFP